jgi:rod shape-determining protein MreD
MLSTAGGSPQNGQKMKAALVTIAALVLQVAVFNRLPLPGSVTPDLVLLTVVALALVDGELVGAVAGFGAGLAADIIPPADHTIGRYALVYCLAGYVCGLFRESMDRSSIVPFMAVAVGALFGTLLYAVVGMLLGDPRTIWAVTSRMLPLEVLYAVLASPFVIWVVLRLYRGGERNASAGHYNLTATRYRAMSRSRG